MTEPTSKTEDKPKWPVYEPPPLWYIQRGERFGK